MCTEHRLDSRLSSRTALRRTLPCLSEAGLISPEGDAEVPERAVLESPELMKALTGVLTSGLSPNGNDLPFEHHVIGFSLSGLLLTYFRAPSISVGL